MATKQPRRQPNPQGDVEVVERHEARTPRRYHVVFHNDDYTTMEFVIMALLTLFDKSEAEAMEIMLAVHHRGYGIVGSYTRDEAETKAEQTMELARQHGQPLRVTTEPEGAGGGGS